MMDMYVATRNRIGWRSGQMMMNLAEKVAEKSEVIAEILKSGCDVEIRKSKDGITVAAVKRTVKSR